MSKNSDSSLKFITHSHLEDTIEKEMADPRRENLMSVELAIQRELAYRRKIAMLNLEINNDSGQELMPLQAHFSSPSGNPSSISNSNPSLSGLKQPTPPSKPVLPSGNASSRPESSSFPSILGVKLSEPSSDPQFLQPQRMQSFTNDGMLKPQADNLFCEVCQVQCPGPLTISSI